MSESIAITFDFDASPERVFDAWVVPAKARRWMFATETGTNVRTDIDARAGGRYSIVDRRDGEDVEHTGQYLEVERPRRLVFELTVPKYSPHASRVAIDIKAAINGCELTLTHSGIDGDVARTRDGWATMLRGMNDGSSPALSGAEKQ
jgi:uncharacterized protein YndB with AHSA1/START domain